MIYKALLNDLPELLPSVNAHFLSSCILSLFVSYVPYVSALIPAVGGFGVLFLLLLLVFSTTEQLSELKTYH